MNRIAVYLACVACWMLTACAGPGPDVQRASIPSSVERAPEGASGYVEKPGWTGKSFMVSAAHPLAVDAGYDILKAGGSALDAAIAVQMVLTLVEPQSSGIGGGAFMLHFDGVQVQAFDGRETAPAAVHEHLFQTKSGAVMAFQDAIVAGRAVGTPGVLRMLELAHRRHGRLPWNVLFEPAIGLATKGFPVSPRLATLLARESRLREDPAAAAYFYDAAGKPHPAGHILTNPLLAKALRDIAEYGADAFYKGRIAADIETKVKQHPRNPGALRASDLHAYRAKERAPVCTDYRRWTVCGMPPPSSGGIAIAQMLGILETTDMPALAPVNGMPGVDAVHLFSEAGRLAYADRNRYVADTDFVALPGNSIDALLDKEYLSSRATLIGSRSMGRAPAGVPVSAVLATDAISPELPSTSHIAIVDKNGNALSMTTTIEDGFGARQMVHGFLLNNQLSDFSFQPNDASGPVANRVQAGKRPRSSMAPTLVFERGSKRFLMAIGSPGGSAIINYVAKALVGVMDWGLNLQQAISLPNIGSRNGPTELESGRAPAGLAAQLSARGHVVQTIEQTSGLQGIMRIRVHGEDMWLGAADPRREGVAKGD
jgi:gamma-glutamyltranspeptidase / glutathione hydrolase